MENRTILLDTRTEILYVIPTNVYNSGISLDNRTINGKYYKYFKNVTNTISLDLYDEIMKDVYIKK